MVSSSDIYFSSLKSMSGVSDQFVQQVVNLINESPIISSELAAYGQNIQIGSGIGIAGNKEGENYSPTIDIITVSQKSYNDLVQYGITDYAKLPNGAPSSGLMDAGYFVGALAHELGHRSDNDYKNLCLALITHKMK